MFFSEFWGVLVVAWPRIPYINIPQKPLSWFWIKRQSTGTGSIVRSRCPAHGHGHGHGNANSIGYWIRQGMCMHVIRSLTENDWINIVCEPQVGNLPVNLHNKLLGPFQLPGRLPASQAPVCTCFAHSTLHLVVITSDMPYDIIMAEY